MCNSGPPPDRCQDVDSTAPLQPLAEFGARTAEWRPFLKAVAAEALGPETATHVDPSDVVQSALTAACQRFSQFRGESADQLRAWVVAIVRNEARQVRRHWRLQKRNMAREQRLLSTPGSEQQLVDQDLTPAARSVQRERAERLLATLDRMTREDRELIYLRHFVGLPHAAIAARQHRSEAAVRQHWLAALERLRRLLREQP